jgi:hypothetical protein
MTPPAALSPRSITFWRLAPSAGTTGEARNSSPAFGTHCQRTAAMAGWASRRSSRRTSQATTDFLPHLDAPRAPTTEGAAPAAAAPSPSREKEDAASIRGAGNETDTVAVTGAEGLRRRSMNSSRRRRTTMSRRRPSACLYAHDAESLQRASAAAHRRRRDNNIIEEESEGVHTDDDSLLVGTGDISKRTAHGVGAGASHRHERDDDKEVAASRTASSYLHLDHEELPRHLPAGEGVTQPLEEEAFDAQSRRRSSVATIADSDVQRLRRCLEEGGPIGISDSNGTAPPTMLTRTVLHSEALERLQNALSHAYAADAATPSGRTLVSRWCA